MIILKPYLTKRETRKDSKCKLAMSGLVDFWIYFSHLNVRKYVSVPNTFYVLWNSLLCISALQCRPKIGCRKCMAPLSTKNFIKLFRWVIHPFSDVASLNHSTGKATSAGLYVWKDYPSLPTFQRACHPCCCCVSSAWHAAHHHMIQSCGCRLKRINSGSWNGRPTCNNLSIQAGPCLFIYLMHSGLVSSEILNLPESMPCVILLHFCTHYFLMAC